MATLLDAPKGPTAGKMEELVASQLSAARRRVRLLDFFLVGLIVAIGAGVVALALQLVHRKLPLPPGTAVIAGGVFGVITIGFAYLMLFRSGRRQINPYFAAKLVEETIPGAKNSIVTWVDFEEEKQLPGSIRTAIGQKAYRDIKGVDVNRAIENKRLLWLLMGAGVLALANLVVAFLPPTRTAITLQLPKDGDATIFNNQEITFQVKVHGRVPKVDDADAVRLRLWYNPDDPEGYEDRPMKPSDDDRRLFSLTLPGKQVRNGFDYQVLAGNATTGRHTVTVKIVPEFREFEIEYAYPKYLKQPPEKSSDANLVAPYGTVVRITAVTTREVKHGHMVIDGQVVTLDGRLVPGRPECIQFELTMERDAAYQIYFTTPEGDKNSDPARFRISVIDPKPAIRTIDLAYEFPKYLRYKPVAIADVRDPEVEGPRGTKLALTVKTNRAVKEAKLEVPGQAPIAGKLLADQPMWVRFDVPELLEDGVAKLTFTPTTGEPASKPKDIPIRLLIDQAPLVQLLKPEGQEEQQPPTGTLSVEGLATDDHGVDKLTLHLKLLGAEDRDLVAKPYRNGMSFQRKEDNSWPSRLEYKDFIRLQDMRMPGDPTWRVAPGMKIEFWLEAIDNCTVQPGPNRGESKPRKTLIVVAPPKKEEPKQIEDRNQKLEQDQQNHEQKQDANNRNEKREVRQDLPKGAEPPKDQPPMGEPMMPPMGNDGNPMPAGKDNNPPMGKQDGNPMPGKEGDPTMPPMGNQGNPMPGGKDGTPGTVPPDMMPPRDPKHEEKTRKVQDALRNADNPSKTEGKQDPEVGPMPRTTEPDGKGTDTPKTKDKGSDVGPTPKMGDPDGKGTDTPMGKGTDSTKPKDKGSEVGPMPRMTDPDGKGNDTPKTKEKGSDAGSKMSDPDGKGTDTPMGKGNNTPKGNTDPKGKDGAGGKPEVGPMPRNMDDPSESPMPKGGMGEQGDLDRELGELERELNSPNPKFDDKKQSDIDRLMRNKETRQKTRDKLEELERNAKDQLTRDKARQAREAGERAAKDYDNEKPNEENVDKLSKKLNSKDEKERRDAEQRLKDWQNDEQARKDLDEEKDRLKKKNRDAGEKVENAMKKNDDARAAKSQEKKDDDRRMNDIAKGLNSDDPKEREQARRDLNEMAKDPKSAAKAEQKLNEMAKDAKTPEEKKNLEDAARQAGEMARKDQKVDPKDLKDMADKLASNDPKAQQEAKDKLRDMMQDPKQRQQAKDMLDQMAKDAKTPEEKRKLEEAREQANQMAQKAEGKDDPKSKDTVAGKDGKQTEKKGEGKDHPKSKDSVAGKDGKQTEKKPGEKVDPKDLERLAKEAAGKDGQQQKDAQRKLEEMANDPKARQQMEDMAKNASSEDIKNAMKDALKKADQTAKKESPKVDPKDLENLAKKFDQMDEKTKQDLQKKFDEAMKDPELKKDLDQRAEDFKKNATPEDRQKLEDMMNKLGRGDFRGADLKPDPADPKNRLKTAELTLDEFKKRINEKSFRESLGWSDDEIARWLKDQESTIAALRRQAQKGDWRDPTIAGPGLKGGPDRIKFDGNNGPDPLRGGRYAPPSGYGDSYKQFTTDATKSGKK